MFKFRDLLVVAALAAGFVFGTNRAQVLSVLEPVIAPIDYYVDAPVREADLKASVDSLTRKVGQLESSVSDRSNQLLHTQQLLEAQEQMARHSRARFELHLQRLRELGNEADVDVNVAGFEAP